VSAYAVGGIGIAIIRAGKYNIDYGDNLRACAPQSESYAGKTTNNFAWNIGTGASVELWENGYADLGYRYVQMGRFNMTSAKKTTRPTDSDQEVGGSRNFSSKIAAHEWSLSLRVGL
jgi:opacity protein-like surface antigen